MYQLLFYIHTWLISIWTFIQFIFQRHVFIFIWPPIFIFISNIYIKLYSFCKYIYMYIYIYLNHIKKNTSYIIRLIINLQMCDTFPFTYCHYWLCLFYFTYIYFFYFFEYWNILILIGLFCLMLPLSLWIFWQFTLVIRVPFVNTIYLYHYFWIKS